MNSAGSCCPKLELDRSSPTPDSRDLNEDKDIASQAVLFVMSGARRGAVHLCARVAQLMRENRRLQQITQTQEALIEELSSRCSLASSAVDSACPHAWTLSTSPQPPSPPSSSPHLPPLPDSHLHLHASPPHLSVSFHLPHLPSSSCSSERWSLSTTANPPHLPHLTPTPDPHPPMQPSPLPIMPHPPPLRQRSDEGAQTQQHPGTSGQRVKKPEGEDMKNFPPVYGAISSKTRYNLKKRERSLRTTSWKKEEWEDNMEEAASSQGEIHQPNSTRQGQRSLNGRASVNPSRKLDNDLVSPETSRAKTTSQDEEAVD